MTIKKTPREWLKNISLKHSLTVHDLEDILDTFFSSSNQQIEIIQAKGCTEDNKLAISYVLNIMSMAKTLDLSEIYKICDSMDAAIYQNDQETLNTLTSELREKILEFQNFLQSKK